MHAIRRDYYLGGDRLAVVRVTPKHIDALAVELVPDEDGAVHKERVADGRLADPDGDDVRRRGQLRPSASDGEVAHRASRGLRLGIQAAARREGGGVSGLLLLDPLQVLLPDLIQTPPAPFLALLPLRLRLRGLGVLLFLADVVHGEAEIALLRHRRHYRAAARISRPHLFLFLLEEENSFIIIIIIIILLTPPESERTLGWAGPGL